ncbi:MAG: hypothetical protein ACE5KA_03960 [Nitrososphaerales archaeon]
MSEDAYARREGFPTKVVMAVLVASVIVLWFAVGQGYFTNSNVGGSTPPTIWLVYQGELYSGIRESYCWTDECVDTEFRDPTGIVEISQGSSVGLLMNNRIRPAVVNAYVFTFDSFGNLAPVGELASEGDDMYRVELQKGIYILQLQARWQNLGEVNYAFKIKVN